MLEERMLVDPAYNDLGRAFATPIGTAIDPSNLPAYLDERNEGRRLRVRSAPAESSSTAKKGKDQRRARAQTENVGVFPSADDGTAAGARAG